MQKEVPQNYFHQGDALSFIYSKDVFALYMEQGTGKSKVAIEKTMQLFEEGEIDCVIIISPNAVSSQWVDEQFEEHYPSNIWNGLVWEGGSTVRERDLFHKYTKNKSRLFIFSTNIEALQSNQIDLYLKLLMEKRKIFMIIDESTRIKSGRRKPKKGKRKGAKRTNKILDFSESIKYKTIMTGTPTPNNPFDLWSQFEFLQKDFFGMNYFYFEHRYGIMLQKRTAGGKKYNVVLDEKHFGLIKKRLKIVEEVTPQIIEEISIDYGMKTKDIILINKMDKYYPYKNLEELHKKISKITYYAKKKDCLDIPEKIPMKLYCKMGKEQNKVYKQLQDEMQAQYFGKELTLTNKLVMALRLQMIAGGLFPYAETDIKINKDGEEYFDTHYEYKIIEDNPKIKVLIEDLQEVSKDTSIIVWARFRGEIELISDALTKAGYSNNIFYGGSSDDIVIDFKAGKFQILVANALKAGEGLNLQIATLQYFYSNSYKSDSRLQAEDRSHRIGQVFHVVYKDIICKGSLDMRIYNVLRMKENLIDYFRSKNSKDFLKEVA